MAKKLLPLCACGCGDRVTKARNQFASAACAQRAARHEQPREAESFKVEGHRGEITANSPREIKTLGELITHCKIDTTAWRVTKFVCNKWNMGDEVNFQVKAWLDSKVEIVTAKDEIASLVKDAKKLITARPAHPHDLHIPTGNMLEIAIPDLHIGKLAWSKETGHGNNDIKISERDFEQALTALVARTSGYKFDQVLFVVGNDLLHSDSKTNATTAGTPQDTDSRYHKSFLTARRLITNGIELLRTIAPVYVPLVPGNHDTLSTWHLGDSLECLYHATPDVHIDNAPTMRKYHQFGKVMLMFTHGDKGKKPDYPLLMATERPKMFGETQYREVHCGHIHKVWLDEFHGIKVRVSPALCAADAWHSEMGFVGQGRSAEAFVWNKDNGLIATAFYTVPDDLAEVA